MNQNGESDSIISGISNTWLVIGLIGTGVGGYLIYDNLTSSCMNNEGREIPRSDGGFTFVDGCGNVVADFDEPEF
jgi:hypothetical protein